MPAESGKGAEDQVAKLGKEIVWLRIALILVLVVLGLVSFVVLQMRTQLSDLTVAVQSTRGTSGVAAPRFVVIERVDKKDFVRAELGVKDGVPRLEFFDASGKSALLVAPPAAAPKEKESPAAKEAEK